jgi:hypothetical protein
VLKIPVSHPCLHQQYILMSSFQVKVVFPLKSKPSSFETWTYIQEALFLCEDQYDPNPILEILGYSLVCKRWVREI